MNFFSRLSNGWTISINSLKVLRANKQLIIFPVLSGISMILIMASLFTVLLAKSGWQIDNIQDPDKVTAYITLFAYYIINYFVVVFFNMALIHCTRLYFNGEEVSVQKGIQFSLSRIGVIFSWAVFAATVGTILKALQENLGSVGKIITGIIGVMWNVATFFVVPIIAYENVGPLNAFKRSTELMKEKWGESLGASFSFGFIQIFACLLIALPLYFLGAMFNVYVGIALALLAIFIIIAIISATETIFVSAVYHNVTGDPVQHLDEQMIDSLFVTK